MAALAEAVSGVDRSRRRKEAGTLLFITSGERTPTGRVLPISDPSPGSSRASQTSNLFIGVCVRPLPLACVPFVGRLPERLQLREVPVQLRLRDCLQCLRPAFAR